MLIVLISKNISFLKQTSFKDFEVLKKAMELLDVWYNKETRGLLPICIYFQVCWGLTYC